MLVESTPTTATRRIASTNTGMPAQPTTFVATSPVTGRRSSARRKTVVRHQHADPKGKSSLRRTRRSGSTVATRWHHDKLPRREPAR